MNWLNCFSNERFGVQEVSRSARSQYERDYDRIIFSSAFRRLQNKTQVFPLPEHIFVHNRLTHSLEVASVGRSLGNIIGKELVKLPSIKKDDAARKFYRNQLKNVIAAACLAHDLGNPAFGHSGEEAISKYFIDKQGDTSFVNQFTKEEWKDLVTFEGNANALRIATKQFKGRLPGGFRLTYSTLCAILKYPCESVASKGKSGPKHLSKFGFFQDDLDAFSSITSKVNMIQESVAPIVYKRHPFVYLVEAADDLCYTIIDFEDAHRLEILTTEEVETLFMGLIKLNKDEDLKHVKKVRSQLREDPNELIAYLRAKTINYLTIAAAETFINNKNVIIKGQFASSLINAIPKAQPILKEIERISTEKIYNHSSVVKIELAGFKIMSGLIQDFVEAALIPKDDRKTRHKKILKLLPKQYNFDEKQKPYQKVMCILDYMSGMTDVYALELYRNIRGIEMPSI
ncbi:MAG TPA: dNTP triphosphohydrolase [Cyclobacteriaceae bacterium]|jgi:dGTPase|nr:dNTP triphosphohydrolase [Cyclobacteriaceae bacterium]